MTRWSVLLLVSALTTCCGCTGKATPTSGATPAPPPDQDGKMVEEVKAQVKKIADATANGDFDTVLNMTHAKALESMGGREKAGQLARAGMDATRKQGFQFWVDEVGEPVIAKSGTTHFAVAPYTMAMSMPGKKGTSKTSLVGVSTDGGKTWKFVQVAAKGGEDEVRRLFPDMPRELTVPKTERKTENVP